VGTKFMLFQFAILTKSHHFFASLQNRTNSLRMKTFTGNKLKATLLLLSLIFVLIWVSSCSPKTFKISHMNKMKWIEGHWSSTDQGITIAEKWKFDGINGFEGRIYIASQKDTIYVERTQIKFGQKNTILFMSSTGQVHVEEYEPMKLVNVKKNSFTFKTEDGAKTVKYQNKKGEAIQINILEIDGETKTRTKYLLEKVTS